MIPTIRLSRAPSLLLLLLPLLLAALRSCSAQDSDHYFCGTSWADASDNCSERQHCVGGTDDECETGGHICFGGTACSVKEGHGNAFKYSNVPYGDISNTRFCGSGWAAAIEGCSIATHCPSGFSEMCPEGDSCYGGLTCNVQDMILEEAEAAEEDGGGSGAVVANAIGKHDPRRSNFCGTSWGDANSKCDMWCPDGENTDCPGGLGCFGNTGCHYSDDLVPTRTPVVPPSGAPTTEAPVNYRDPSNMRFCGLTWSLALTTCSIETHCPSGNDDDCPKGHSCHQVLMDCNIVDMMEVLERPEIPTTAPTPSPVSSSHASNNKFCGKSWQLANDNCSLATHCPDDNCDDGYVCYGGLMGCNASEMTRSPTLEPIKFPTESPTQEPTAPTESPTLGPTTETRAPTSDAPTVSFPPTSPPMIPLDDIRHSYWCGTSWSDAQKCHEPCITGQDTDCSNGWTCIAFTSCRPAPPATSKPTRKPTTPKPTRKPTTPRPTQPPSPRPTPAPTARARTDDPATEAPRGELVEAVFTRSPATAQPSRQPTREPTSEPTREPTKRPTAKPTMKPTNSSGAQSKLEFSATPAPVATPPPSGKPSRGPTRDPTRDPTLPPTKRPSNPPQPLLLPSEVVVSNIPAPPHELMAEVGSVLVSASSDVTNKVLLVTTRELARPTRLYRYAGFLNALGAVSKGDAGPSHFYLGDGNVVGGANYGLANVALFLAQAAVETVRFDICDDISWEKDVFGRYAIANGCGQGRFAGVSTASYQDSNPCAEHEAHMVCPVDPGMSAVAETHGVFVGAPPPLECRPRTAAEPFTGAWDPSLGCEEESCDAYEGQRAGGVDPASVPAANSFGKNDVEGCCWWGRGAFPRGSAGTCMMGKLNYYLGKQAFDQGRRSSARYKEIDFCKDPSAVCRGYYEEDDDANSEIRWLMGMMYWTSKVQAYDEDGWSYLERLKLFVDGGMNDAKFLEEVSRIVTRGCHDQSRCGHAVSSPDRRAKFEDIIYYFGKARGGTSLEGDERGLPTRSPATQYPSRKPTPPPTNPAIVALADPTDPPATAPPTDYPTSRATQESAAAPTPVPPSLAATSPADVETPSPQASAIAPEEDYLLTPGELAQRLNYANAYCASSSAEANAECATSLRTCNYGDPPCGLGKACWENVICSIAWSDMEFGPVASAETEEGSTSEAETTNESSPPPQQHSFLITVPCHGACLRPLSAAECAAAGDALLASLPWCPGVAVGELCENAGQCGALATNDVGNCPGGEDAYVRVSAEQCPSLLTTTTESPSLNWSFLTSSPPTSRATGSPAPDENDADSAEEKSFFDMLREGDGEENKVGPGAWWTMRDPSSSARLRAMAILPLLCYAILSLFSVTFA